MSSPPYKPLVFIISAPSGSGKSTLVNELLKKVDNLEFSISYTTRAPRGSEMNGRQYYFVSRPEFEKMIRDGEFLEHAEVFGNYYGTASRFLHEAEQNGRDLLLDIDVQGAAQIQHKLPDATSIFILPPDRKTLEERLRKRSEDREEVIQRRLVTATREDSRITNDTTTFSSTTSSRTQSKHCERLCEANAWCERGSRYPLRKPKTMALADRCRLANVRDRLKPILASFKPPGDSGTCKTSVTIL